MFVVVQLNSYQQKPLADPGELIINAQTVSTVESPELTGVPSQCRVVFRDGRKVYLHIGDCDQLLALLRRLGRHTAREIHDAEQSERKAAA